MVGEKIFLSVIYIYSQLSFGTNVRNCNCFQEKSMVVVIIFKSNSSVVKDAYPGTDLWYKVHGVLRMEVGLPPSTLGWPPGTTKIS